MRLIFNKAEYVISGLVNASMGSYFFSVKTFLKFGFLHFEDIVMINKPVNHDFMHLYLQPFHHHNSCRVLNLFMGAAVQEKPKKTVSFNPSFFLPF